jgi:hypothetical protein
MEYEYLIPAGSVQITDEEAKSIQLAQKIASQDLLTYIEKRKAEYPPITDYLDGVVKGNQEEIEKYIANCLAVKQKYPKP